MMARSTSGMASCFGFALVLWTSTLLCIPASKASVKGLGVCFLMNALVQCLTAVFFGSDNCHHNSIGGRGGGDGGGYFGGKECHPNKDLAFCIASAILYAAAGSILCVSRMTNTIAPGLGSMEVYTWSSEAKSSNPAKGLLRTVEKCWTKVPSGSTLMATVYVEQRTNAGSRARGRGKTKMTYSIHTDLLPP